MTEEVNKQINVWSRVIDNEQLTAREHIYFFLHFIEKYANSIGDDRRPYAVDLWEKAYALWRDRE